MSTAKVRQLITLTGYLQIFNEYCTRTKTYKEAWELTERDYFRVFGVNRYSSYESFNKDNSIRLTQSYPPEILKLQKIEGFLEWMKQIQNEMNCGKMKAFDIINEKYFNFFGCYKYSDYQSFQVCLRRKCQ